MRGVRRLLGAPRRVLQQVCERGLAVNTSSAERGKVGRKMGLSAELSLRVIVNYDRCWMNGSAFITRVAPRVLVARRGR